MPSHVRPANDTDLDLLAGIEAAADTVFGPLFGTVDWGSAPSGRERLNDPGFILVVAESDAGPAVGFAHVIEHEATAHLEQLSVRPEHAGQGHGRALLAASLDEAADRGATRMTLRTYADVPWNGPFYASAGFREKPDPDDDFHRSLLAAEIRLDLSRHGRRVHMERELPRGMQMDAEAFEALVVDELDRLPDEMVAGLENVVFVVEDRPENGEDLFGLYEGLALTERGQYGMGELPDRIIIYRHAHLAASESEEELRGEVHTTLVHEIAHFFGLDDDQLHELGWA